MDGRKIHILLTCVEAGSMMKAAERLGYTPSGLSHMMDSIEDEFDLKILSRGKYGIKLTPDGEKLLPLLREYEETEQKLQNEVMKLKRQKKALIRIGAYASIARHWLPSILSELKKISFNANIEIVVVGRKGLFEALRMGDVDIIFASKVDESDFDFIPLKKDYFLAVLPLSNKQNSNGIESFNISALNNYTFIMPSFGTETDVQSALKENNIKPELLPASADYPVVVSMVSSGLGITMLPELVLREYNDNIQKVPFNPPIYRELGIWVKSSKSLTMVERKFISYVKELNLI